MNVCPIYIDIIHCVLRTLFGASRPKNPPTIKTLSMMQVPFASHSF